MEYDTKVTFGFMLMLLHKRRRFIVIQSNATENDATLSLNKLNLCCDWLRKFKRTCLQPDALQSVPNVGGALPVGGAMDWHLRHGLLQTGHSQRRSALRPWRHTTHVSVTQTRAIAHTHNTRWYTPVSVSWKSGSMRWRPLGFLLKVPGSGGILLLSSSSLNRTQKHIKSHLKLKNSPSHTENITWVEWSHSGSATAPASLRRSVKQLPGRIKPLPASL